MANKINKLRKELIKELEHEECVYVPANCRQLRAARMKERNDYWKKPNKFFNWLFNDRKFMDKLDFYITILSITIGAVWFIAIIVYVVTV